MTTTQPHNKQNVKVYIRLKSAGSSLKDSRISKIIDTQGRKEIVIKQAHGKTYGFDGVFNQASNQSEVYERVARPMINEVLSGYNCTIFTYGQTGSGKTYTMDGFLHDDLTKIDKHDGLIARTVVSLFEKLPLTGQEYSVRVAHMEIYNEEIFDLLNDDGRSLRIFDDQKQKSLIKDLSEITVHDSGEVLDFLKCGREKQGEREKLRKQKSHMIFTLTVNMLEKNYAGETVTFGKINFVDLAGSESVSRGLGNQRSRDTYNVNQSLLALGRVVQAIIEGSTYIPYRESKLTRILQDSLSGKSKTSLIAAIFTETSNLEETLCTLDFASKVRRIVNTPEINVLSKQFLLKMYAHEIEKLKKDLIASKRGDGIMLNEENYSSLLAELNLKTSELTARMTEIRNLESQVIHLESDKTNLETDVQNCMTTLLEYEKKLNTHSEKRMEVINKFQSRGEILHKQATRILEVANVATRNEEILGEKLKHVYAVVAEKETQLKKALSALSNIVHAFSVKIDSQNKENVETSDKMIKSVQQKMTEKQGRLQEISKKISDLSKVDKTLQKKIKCIVESNTKKLADCLTTINVGEVVQNLSKQINAEVQQCIKDEFNQLQSIVNSTAQSLNGNFLNIAEEVSVLKNCNKKLMDDVDNSVNHFLVPSTRKVLQCIKDDIRSLEIIERNAAFWAESEQRAMELENKTLKCFQNCLDIKTEKDQISYNKVMEDIENCKLKISNIRNTSSDYSKEMSNILRESNRQVNVLCKNNSKNKEKMVTSLAQMPLAIDKSANSIKKKLNVMRNDVQARSAVSQENLQENFAVVTAQNLEIEKIHTENLEKTFVPYREHLSCCKMNALNDKQFLIELQEKLREKEAIENHLTTQSSDFVSEFQETVTGTFNNLSNLPKPTGTTPAKTTRKYPKRLVSIRMINLNSSCSSDNDYSIVEEDDSTMTDGVN